MIDISFFVVTVKVQNHHPVPRKNLSKQWILLLFLLLLFGKIHISV
jgi:hypothetical protein